MAVQPCMGWIPIKKKKTLYSNDIIINNYSTAQHGFKKINDDDQAFN